MLTAKLFLYIPSFLLRYVLCLSYFKVFYWIVVKNNSIRIESFSEQTFNSPNFHPAEHDAMLQMSTRCQQSLEKRDLKLQGRKNKHK